MFAVTDDSLSYLVTHPFLKTKLATVFVSELGSLHVRKKFLERVRHVLTHQADQLIGRGKAAPAHSQAQSVRRLFERYDAGNGRSRLGCEHVTHDCFGVNVRIVGKLEMTDMGVIVRAVSQVFDSIYIRADSFDSSPRTGSTQARLLASDLEIAARRVRSLLWRSWIVARG